MNTNNMVYKVAQNLKDVTKIDGLGFTTGTSNSDIIYCYAPFATNEIVEVRFVFEQFFSAIDNNVPPLKLMPFLITDTDTIASIIPSGEVEDGYSLWKYPTPNSITGANNTTEDLSVDLSFRHTQLESPDEYLGVYITSTTDEATINTELKAEFPSATEDDFVNVLVTGTNEYKSWLFDGTDFNKQTTILNLLLDDETFQISEVIKPNSIAERETLDRDITDDILQILATKLGINEAAALYLLKDFISAYDLKTVIESDDYFVVQENGGGNKKVTFAEIVEGSRENFVGIFETASGLSCPDPDDLLCVYPNGIAEPNDRLGWVATVNNPTVTKWAWSTATNSWQDTGQAPTIASSIGYDSSSDPSTNAGNVQQMGVDHGVQIDANKTKTDTNELKTQNLNTDGKIATDMEIESGADLPSSDLDTGTSGTYQAIIQALIAEFGRQNAQDLLIQANADDIALRLVSDFSSLLNKANPDNTDLLALWDGSTNRNISYAELVNAIETEIQFYQGYFADIAALRVAFPESIPDPTVRQGFYAGIGDTDTQAVWDVEGNVWVEVASKLYFSKTAGEGLEVRVGTLEGQVSSIQATLLTKEDIVNKVNTISGNESDTDKYLNAKAIYDYVNPIKLINDEDRVNSLCVQTNNFIQRLSSDTELTDGRREYFYLPGGFQAYPDIAQLSIDGGSTFKNLALYVVSADNYVDVDLSLGLLFGQYFSAIYNASLQKWIFIGSDEFQSRLAGPGYNASMSIAGNYAENQTQNQRLSILEGGSVSGKSFIVARNKAENLAISDTNLTKVDFTIEDVESNDDAIIESDVNLDLILKEDSEPGYEITLSAAQDLTVDEDKKPLTKDEINQVLPYTVPTALTKVVWQELVAPTDGVFSKDVNGDIVINELNDAGFEFNILGQVYNDSGDNHDFTCQLRVNGTPVITKVVTVTEEAGNAVNYETITLNFKLLPPDVAVNDVITFYVSSDDATDLFIDNYFELVSKANFIPGSTKETSFYVFDLDGAISVGNEVLLMSLSGKDRFTQKFLSNEYIKNTLSGFPLKLGVYRQSSDVELVTITSIELQVESKFTGPGTATDRQLVILDPSTASADGDKTTQEGVNQEVALDIKDARLYSTVLIANYQSNGRFMTDASDIKLTTNKVVRVLFSGNGTDLAELVELSLDNGSTYYDVEYRLTNVDLTVENANEHVMDLYFTGTKFIATYVDAPIINQSLPYVDADGVFNTPENGVDVVIERSTVRKPDNAKGRTLSELLLNPFFQSKSIWVESSAGYTVSNEEATITASAQFGGIYQDIQIVSGQSYYVSFEHKNSQNNIYFVERITNASNTNNLLPIVSDWTPYSDIITATANNSNRAVQFLDFNTSGFTAFDIRNVQLIPVPVDITTEEEMEALLSEPLDFGIHNVGTPKQLLNLLDNRDDFSAWDLTNPVDKTKAEGNIPLIKGEATEIETVPFIWETNTTYYLITWVVENILSSSYTVMRNANNGASASLTIGAGEIGIFVQEFTTGSSITLNEHDVRGSGGTGEIYFKQVIIKANGSKPSDTEALRLIKGETTKVVVNQEFINGNFENGDTGYTSVGSTDAITITDKMVFDGTPAGSGGYYVDLLDVKGDFLLTLDSTKYGTNYPNVVICDGGTFSNQEGLGFTDGRSSQKFSGRDTGIRLYLQQLVSVPYDNVIIDNIMITELQDPLTQLSASELATYILPYFEGQKAIDFPILERKGTTIKTNGKNLDANLFEQGQIQTANGEEADSSSRIRNIGYIDIFPDTIYTQKINQPNDGSVLLRFDEGYFYDENKNFISLQNTTNVEERTFTTPSNARYFRYHMNESGFGDFTPNDIGEPQIQLELGSTATAYAEYIEPLIANNPVEKAGIGGVYDDDDFERFYKDRNDILKNKTGFAKSVTLTNSSRYAITIDEINIVNPVNNTTPIKGSLIIGNDIYPAFSENDVITEDVRAFSIDVESNVIWIRILDADLTTQDSAGVEAYLQGNNVFLQLEQTPIPRSEANNNVSEWDGQLHIGDKFTYQHESSSGVLGKFYMTSAINTYGQTKINTDSIIKLVKDLRALGMSFDSIESKVATLFEQDGELNKLDTVDKSNLVNAVNEILKTITDGLETKQDKRVELYNGGAQVSTATLAASGTLIPLFTPPDNFNNYTEYILVIRIDNQIHVVTVRPNASTQFVNWFEFVYNVSSDEIIKRIFAINENGLSTSFRAYNAVAVTLNTTTDTITKATTTDIFLELVFGINP